MPVVKMIKNFQKNIKILIKNTWKKCHTKSTITLNKRGKRAILLIILLIIVIIITKFIPKNYKIEYKVNGAKITEQYIKKDKMYVFKIKKNNKTYETISYQKYTPKRKLINKVKKYEKDNTSCVVLDSKKIDTNILCLEDGKRIDYHLIDILPSKYYKKYKNNEKKYKNININLVDDTTYLIWNYTGFYKLNKDKLQTIDLFKDDNYDIDLVTIVDKYLLIADYDQKYNYNKLIKINLENNKKEELKLGYDISFDSTIIGNYKKYIYIVDKKNKKEYEINIKNGNTEIVSRNKMGKVIKNGKWEKIKLNKIITDNITFDKIEYNAYKSNNGLYMYQKNIKAPIKISDKEIREIVYASDEKVYYLVGEELYKYDFEHGETKILDYFELNFNYKNIIYIYN